MNLPSEQEICFPVNCWLSEDQGDGDTWREIPIRRPKKECLPCMSIIYNIFI